MKTFICVFEPTTDARTNGAVPLTIAFNAANAKIAAATAMIKLSEEYPDSMDNFNIDEPIICEDALGSPRPALDKFDEKFALENEFDGEKWVPVIYEDFNKINVVIRIAAILLFNKTQFTRSDVSKAVSFVNESKELPKIRNIAEGLGRIVKLDSMNAEQTAEMAQAIYEIADDNVSIIKALGLGNNWLAEEPKSEAASEEEPMLKRDYEALDIEIALALLEVNPSDAKSADVRRAKEIISNDDKAWKRWSMDLRTFPGVLNIPREQIFALITESLDQPELIDNANARKAFIDSKLGTEQPKITSLGNGRFSVDNLIQQPANDEQSSTIIEEKSPVIEEKPKRTRKKKKPAKVEESTATETAIEPTKEPVVIPATEMTVLHDDFEQRAAVLDDLLKENNDNLSIWKRVQRTDPRFTKPLDGMGFTGTSINGTYMIMRATEIFGPIGIGWNYEVIEERFIDGKPLTEPVLDERNKQVATRFLRNGDGTLFCEQHHSVKIKFWYLTPTGDRAEFESYGATPYLYQTHYGPKSDGEIMKKSLTDAIKKALSMLGFSSDIYLGMHENPEYVAKNKIESDIKAAVDDADEMIRIKNELDDKLTKNAKAMENAITKSELNGISNSIIREIDIHIKSAKERRDHEVEKYLNARLIRLKEIKNERLIQLEQKEEAI
ncbi:hypothetical protein [Providencia sp. PROV236]|uniref:hypothetical protein n=1 Tax=Providencia sp. PROV236 TaxID=2936798 RepID=UPI0034E236CC